MAACRWPNFASRLRRLAARSRSDSFASFPVLAALEGRAESIQEWPIDERATGSLTGIVTGVVTGLVLQSIARMLLQ